MQTSVTASNVAQRVSAHEKDMVDLLSGLIRIPALGPKNGGQGEMKKAKWLAEYCERQGFKVEWFNAPCNDVPDRVRPNLLVRIPGKSHERALWIMSHIDVVPPGNESDWKTSPFEPVMKDGKLYGRGSEDDCQSLAAAFWAAKSILESGEAPTVDTNLLFVADEETGSEFGIQWMLQAHRGLFGKDDLILVPDGGDPKGEYIEVAEKTILWLKFTVHGKQAHGSMPNLGNNSTRGVAQLTMDLDKALHARFPAKDKLFMPPESTFEPTKREANVPNVNTLPGKDVFYFDTRILPKYDPDAPLKLVKAVVKKFEKRTGLKVDVDVVQHDKAAPPTSPDAEIVRRLRAALTATRRVKPKVWGVGGGTVAAIFRRHGYAAAVWSTYDELAHQPNEYCVVKNMVADALVYAHLMLQPETEAGRGR
ncbi:MAG TPA: M20 family metallo-hydrolase [Candidatus Thermoplasmatota archaeon]|nr:M20 family metallo-hydrolase [Candidatus Thermoplasmatota archaeon]